MQSNKQDLTTYVPGGTMDIIIIFIIIIIVLRVEP